MPTKNPRINISIEEPLYAAIQELARQKGLSMSMVTRDLITKAMEIEEDIMLTAFAEEREESFDSIQALSHDEVWE